jgi:pimeloyl-ACP methyl ester carboxylesterase
MLSLSTVIQFACLPGPSRVPNLDRIFAQAREHRGKRPIIVLPGILGSELVNGKTGKLVWPALSGSLQSGLTLPTSPDLAANRDDLRPGKIIAGLKFARFLPEVYVYRGLLDALRLYGGYQEGDWDNPGPNGDKDTFYAFSYDWRHDNVENARELFKRIESLKQKLNRPDLRFNIVAHSMGGLIARYAAMYGDSDLPADGIAPSPTWPGARHIQRIIMMGVPNEGSMDSLATILRGYSLTEGLRPRLRLFSTLSKELAFSSLSVFELLPHQQAVRFLDENLQPLSVDLYDPAVWNKYSWLTGAGRETGKSLAGAGAPAADKAVPDGRTQEQKRHDGYLTAVLHRARRFQEALDAPVGNAPVSFFSFTGDCEETLNAPVILRDEKKNRWETLTEPRDFRTSTGKKISRREAIAAMYVPGDGRVTRRSALAADLSRGSGFRFLLGLPIDFAVFGCDVHGNLPNNAMLQDNMLTALVGEIIN